MAHSLNLEVIAEGVETLAQRDALSDSGCKHFQGYLFGKPVAVADFGSFSLLWKSALNHPSFVDISRLNWSLRAVSF